jgi:hypothetical protein
MFISFIILERWATRDDAIVVSEGKSKQLWDSLSEPRSSLYETRLEKAVLRSVIMPLKTAQFNQILRPGWRHTVKSLRIAESV